ncbi:hypothetical protein E1B28_005545 [Marasmius oreades]|uniref:Uncharacterized protein n=1 Tax=Marasmius oreades TaxID=181124 RepID=A0A9P7S3S3_9AGAR|nr:uncharacterized protein E1B28_005545 [Marasmius oreades]KAG7094725.1 hypothetical protein E1B28_005545 [Marasmius oreades]
MFDDTSMYSPLSRLFVILLLLFSVQARTLPSRNVTVDDSDPQIFYSPGWKECKTLNTERMEFGKKCHWSDRDDAYAEFTFIGVAVYLLSPSWMYPVRVQITVDSDLVDFQDWEISRGRENIAWAVSGLENGTHTLRIEKGEQAQYVVLEALIYTSTTIPGPGSRYHHARSFEASSPDQTSLLNTSTPSITTLYRRDDQQSKQPVIVGAVVGLCIALIGVGLAIVFIRYRKTILAKYGHLIGIPTIVGDETLPTDSTTRSPQMAPTRFSTPLHAAFTAPETEARNARPAMPGFDPGTMRHEKALPSPPSQTSSTTPTSIFARNLSRLGSKRRLPGPSLTVQVINSGDNLKTNPTKSTSSSFFPKPVHETENCPTRSNRSYSVISQLDGGSEKPLQEPKNPHPPRSEMLPSSTIAGSRPTDETQGKGVPNNPRHGSQSSASTGMDTESPLSSSPEILGKHHFPPRNSLKNLSVRTQLTSITETPIPGRSSATDSPSSSKSVKPPFKRKSDGRLRVEKDKQRRRHRRVLVSPSGPRDLYSDLSSRPSSRVVSSVSNSARASTIMDLEPSINPVHMPRNLPRPLPPRPNIPTPSSTENRSETPLPPYPIGSELLPLYFEKSKRVSRKSLRPPPFSATSNRHFLPSPPPSATSSGDIDIAPVNQTTPLPRPLPVVVEKRASRISPRKLPNRPRAFTDSAPSNTRLPTTTHNKQNRSIDLPLSQQARNPATSLVPKEEVPKDAPKVNQVKPKKSSDSSVSAVSSASRLQRAPFLQSRSAPLFTMQDLLLDSERHPPTSVPSTPQLNSWSDSGTYRYTKSIPGVEDDTERSETGTSGDDRLASSWSTLLPAPSGPLTSTTPLNIVSVEKRKISRVPPPLIKLDPTIPEKAEVQERDQSSPSLATVSRIPTTARVNIPPPPHTPPPPTPPTPPTPRRRAKVWDDLGRRRGDRITPPTRDDSLFATTTNMGGSAYSV